MLDYLLDRSDDLAVANRHIEEPSQFVVALWVIRSDCLLDEMRPVAGSRMEGFDEGHDIANYQRRNGKVLIQIDSDLDAE